MSTLPKFYPRGQINGVMRWVCLYCGGINKDDVRPGTVYVTCSRCQHHIWPGIVFHVPISANTKIPRDKAIPSWADDEYPFDTISDRVWEAIPPAFFDPNRPIKQRGRVHITMIHDAIYVGENDGEDIIPQRPEKEKT